MIFAGNGVRLGHAERELFEAIEALGIPVLTTWLAHDILPDEHPLFIGRPGAVAPRGSNFALQNSDFLLAIGNRLDLVITGYSHENFARAAKKVVVDIDPEELGKLQMPSELRMCETRERSSRNSSPARPHSPAASRDAWLASCKEWFVRYPILTPEFLAHEESVSTYVFADTLSELLGPDDYIVSGSSGAAIEIFLLPIGSALASVSFSLPD